jgi:hypothetical protein
MLALLRFVLCVAAMIAAFGVAHAEGRPCPSITQNGNECVPLPRVTAKGNLRVEVITRKRSLTFALRKGDEIYEDLAPSCPGGKCGCTEYVEHFDFKGPVPGFRQVNAFEMRAAGATKCSIDNSSVVREAKHFAVSAQFISTAIFELEYCHGCGGSCHGTTVLATYDARSGKALRLRDILKPGSDEALAPQLADDFLKAHAEIADRERKRASVITELSVRPLLGKGFYVENGVVYANLDSFVMGCADGSFYPVAVRADLIDPAVAALLKP